MEGVLHTQDWGGGEREGGEVEGEREEGDGEGKGKGQGKVLCC